MKQATKTSVHTGDGNPALLGVSEIRQRQYPHFFCLSNDIGITSDAVIANQYCNASFSGRPHTRLHSTHYVTPTFWGCFWERPFQTPISSATRGPPNHPTSKPCPQPGNGAGSFLTMD